MAELFKFSTHGVTVFPEYSSHYTNISNGLYMRRAGWGTQVKQKKGTSNWFHIPLTTASALDGDIAKINNVSFRAAVNNQAVIKKVHVSMMHQSPKDQSRMMLVNQDVNFTGVDDLFGFSFPKIMVDGGILISVFVEFEEIRGQVIFKTASANLFEQ